MLRSTDFAPGPPPIDHAGLDGARSQSELSRTIFLSVARIGLQVAQAIDYANHLGVLHRDIKPSNLLLDAMANVWVAYFGLAKMTEADDLTQTGQVVGIDSLTWPHAHCLFVRGPVFHGPGRTRPGRALLPPSALAHFPSEPVENPQRLMVQCRLGQCLVAQAKDADAEPLLLSAYAGLKPRQRVLMTQIRLSGE